MASVRTIEAPGIELREFDRSSYNNTIDNSLPNASTVLITGVASKGENYIPQWINSKQSFLDKFGAPETEFEKYFYNGCIEILNRGGICIACKLPYDNVESNIDAKGNASYSYCQYTIDTSEILIKDTKFKELTLLDNELTSYFRIKNDNSSSSDGKMNITQLDDLKTGNANIANLKNKIRIVDVSRGRFSKTSFKSVDTSVNIEIGIQKADGISQGNSSISYEIETKNVSTDDSLGIFPVITTPINALYFQQAFNSISIENSDDNYNQKTVYDLSGYIEKYNAVNSLTAIQAADSVKDKISLNLNELPMYSMIQTHTSAFNDETISKIAAEQFPLIKFRNSEHLDTRYLKYIGIVVFKAYSDPANNGMVNFQMLESFVGSLDKNAKSPIDNSSTFIDNVVNNNSRYINVFSNIDPNLLKSVSTLYICNQQAKMLGFYEKECEKNINVSQSIINPLNRIFSLCEDPNRIPLDLVVDAGVSNIAQFYDSYLKSRDGHEIKYGYENEFQWYLSTDKSLLKESTQKWQYILKKFDDFCRYVRKDCMFIADGLRPFCLNGSTGNNVQKIVRNTRIGASVEKNIVPLIRSVDGINSSYSAGYCDWFQIADEYTGDYFWCPPSIKAASIYIYCDTYFHSWDAPAGMTRGIVPNVIDAAFSPNKDDAGKIYQQSWNYAINYPLDGIIMEGQKTFQQNKTALDRINVRRLLLKLEKQVVRAAKYFLYEGNTAYLRQKFVDTIRPFFENAVNGNGISEYAIKCDDELNTTQTIENNELHCKIAIKPIKTIEYIVLSFICTSQSANVYEEVTK